MKFCKACHKAGPALDTCGSFATCPQRSAQAATLKEPQDIFPDVDPDKMVVLQCERKGCNGATLAFPIHDMLRGKAQADFRCGQSAEMCQCKVMNMEDALRIAETSVTGKKAAKAPKA